VAVGLATCGVAVGFAAWVVDELDVLAVLPLFVCDFDGSELLVLELL
jgi:hypothetical protein